MSERVKPEGSNPKASEPNGTKFEEGASTSEAVQTAMADLEQQQNGELEESLRFEPLEDLDDVEFDIPQIDFTPTLNEILDANDDDLDLAEDFEEEEVAGSNLDVSMPDGVRLPVSLLERISLGSGGDAADASAAGWVPPLTKVIAATTRKTVVWKAFAHAAARMPPRKT